MTIEPDLRFAILRRLPAQMGLSTGEIARSINRSTTYAGPAFSVEDVEAELEKLNAEGHARKARYGWAKP